MFTKVSATAAVLAFVTAQASALYFPRHGCDISKATFSVPAGLTAPTTGPSFIGLAAGVQNYTCTASTSTWTNVGAVAELVDGSCLYSTPFFNSAVDHIYGAWEKAPASVTTQEIISTAAKFPTKPEVLGQHYYVPSPSGTGVSPKWDFTSASFKGNSEAFVVASKTAAVNAPNAATDITWVFLTAVEGELADNVYRVQTRGGQPPASCTPGTPDISVKYAAQYWLYGGEIKH
ncbi:hypothetical protein PUNSTDRAFT_44769 [Punctularia strigosozonata HHB-11173 SS5]|uniref:uncharacterized protein n=1 Tax=Punctularia strigosozonata (strain HHB-11173) TaxID=741275 RepID=UPI0004417458|nr:uncharacterized protein PUNSTDRAFT_44769 [Punctularia strigosozonata HHB-11173 SS5]EIN08187.1 hypothetical protein PUNSTDRAFT_44769 [Punctularia strigosozonata HHB-11173 SS5]